MYAVELHCNCNGKSHCYKITDYICCGVVNPLLESHNGKTVLQKFALSECFLF